MCSLSKHKLVITYLQCGYKAFSFRFVDTVDWSLFLVLFYQYPLTYCTTLHLKRRCPLCGTLVWPDMCSDDLSVIMLLFVHFLDSCNLFRLQQYQHETRWNVGIHVPLALVYYLECTVVFCVVSNTQLHRLFRGEPVHRSERKPSPQMLASCTSAREIIKWALRVG